MAKVKFLLSDKSDTYGNKEATKMGSISCARCGTTIKLDSESDAGTTPIAVTDRKEGIKYLKFVCDDCKEYVIRKTYQQLQEDIVREQAEEIGHR